MSSRTTTLASGRCAINSNTGTLEVVSEAEVNGHATQRLANTSNLTFRRVASDA